jgi:hypothetical protein
MVTADIATLRGSRPCRRYCFVMPQREWSLSTLRLVLTGCQIENELPPQREFTATLRRPEGCP